MIRFVAAAVLCIGLADTGWAGDLRGICTPRADAVGHMMILKKQQDGRELLLWVKPELWSGLGQATYENYSAWAGLCLNDAKPVVFYDANVGTKIARWSLGNGFQSD